jgi:hypothetical protein
MSTVRIPDIRPRVTGDLLAALARRLTPRDHQILALVWEHRVLTTSQITEVFFSGQRAATTRLNILYRHRTLDRAQPRTPAGGSAAFHYVLDEAGAMVLAADRGLTRAEFGYRRERATAILLSQKLAHTVGVNGFFTALHAEARRQPGAACLAAWWPEWRCAAEWHGRIHPDAYGRWRENGPHGDAEADFFLEYDRGTETLARVAAKLDDYQALYQVSRIPTPVLFWLPSAAREAGLRKLIAATTLPVATAAARAPGHTPAHPAGPAWLPAGRQQPRLRLADLARAWPRLNGTTHRRRSA